jgi:hypothetical protein
MRIPGDEIINRSGKNIWFTKTEIDLFVGWVENERKNGCKEDEIEKELKEHFKMRGVLIVGGPGRRTALVTKFGEEEASYRGWKVRTRQDSDGKEEMSRRLQDPKHRIQWVWAIECIGDRIVETSGGKEEVIEILGGEGSLRGMAERFESEREIGKTDDKAENDRRTGGAERKRRKRTTTTTEAIPGEAIIN